MSGPFTRTVGERQPRELLETEQSIERKLSEPVSLTFKDTPLCQVISELNMLVPGVNIVGRFLLTFKEYPPSQVGGSLSIEKALQMVQNGASGGGK